MMMMMMMAMIMLMTIMIKIIMMMILIIMNLYHHVMLYHICYLTKRFKPQKISTISKSSVNVG